MNESSLLRNLTLNPSEPAFSFPPHRRRPLRSRTYRALIGVLSHCRTNSPRLQIQVDGGDSQPRAVTEENGLSTFNDVTLKAVPVPLPNSKQSEDTLVKETSISENKETVNFQDGGSDFNQATSPEWDQMNSVTDGVQEVALANSICHGGLLVVESQMADVAIQVAKAQENSNVVLDNQMDDLHILEELQVDKEFSIDAYSEVLDSCFGMDVVFETSKTLEDNKENGAVLEENIPKEAEHELQLKAMELEKLIHSPGMADSSFCQDAEEEIEEGEISAEAGAADVSFDSLYEDAASVGERTTEMVHTSEDYFNEEEFMCGDDDTGCRQHQMSDPLPINVVNSDCNSMKVKSRIIAGEMQICHSQNLIHGSHIKTQKSGPIAPCFEKQSPTGRNLQKNAADQIFATFEQDGDAKRKKRKNGPLIKERRAKKKKKERLKRAEKNKKLGVKRLKLQPILKPKTVSYCRHYLHGRCHEGEKCKFSHDTVPLTKSKPCGHFARHSCMKGDDCPYDHQLSKYPCKNYSENGFCSRGSDCLFSHEMPAKQSLSMTPTTSNPELTSAQHTVPGKDGSLSKVNKPEVNFSSPLNNSNYSKLTDNHDIICSKADAKLPSAGYSNGKSTELLAARTAPRTAGQAPKGISFLSNKGTSLDDTSKHEQNGSIKDVPRKPRGINFLSFARPTSDDSSSKMFSKMILNSSKEIRNSLVDDTSEGKPTSSLPESVRILKVDMQMSQNATTFVTDMNEKVNGTLWTLPQQRFFRSFDPIISGRANSHFKKDDTALLSVIESQSTSSKLQDQIRIPSLPFGGLSDKLTGGQSATLPLPFRTSFLSNTPSSVQKAVQSTLAFAANFEPAVKVGSSFHQPGS